MWLTMDEMARELKVSKKILRRWMKKGCPHFRENSRSKIFFVPQKVYEWLEKNFERHENRGRAIRKD